MILQVFHGSYMKIGAVDLAKGQDNRDFGKGFYVTKFLKHAQAWANVVGRRHGTKGFVTEFKFYQRAFSDVTYKTLRFDDYNEQWLDFVILNRDPATQEQRHDYDIVEGPVADDKVQNKIELYLKGRISKGDFLTELKYHEQTHQICFCTRKSLQMLELMDDDPNFNVRIISEPILEKLMLDRNLNEEEAADLFYTSKTFGKLADESTLLHQKPWADVYEMLKAELKDTRNTR